MELEPVQPVQMSIYQSSTYRRDLTWLHFIDGSKGSRKEARYGATVLHIPQPIHNKSIQGKSGRKISRDKEQPQKTENPWKELKIHFSWRQF